MRIAIVSDIHANLAAFETVLAHAKAIGYDRMVCLGDVVGYGPDPVECIDLVREHCEWTLLGNHDFAAVYEPTNFNPGAAKAVFWTRAQTLEGEWLRRHVAALQQARDEDRISDTDFLDKKCAAEVEQRERVDFMFRISPRRILLDRYICVHASPSRPVNEYLFPTDVENNTKRLERNFGLLTLPTAEGERPASAIVGHTHCPGFILEAPPDPVEVARVEAELAAQAAREQEGGAFRTPLVENAISRIPRNYEFEGFAVGADTWTPNDDEMPAGCRFILNPGSVGQPRDGDPRACYVMLEVGENGARDRFTFHRVAYDIARTQSKLRAFAAEGAPLVEWLWERSSAVSSTSSAVSSTSSAVSSFSGVGRCAAKAKTRRSRYPSRLSGHGARAAAGSAGRALHRGLHSDPSRAHALKKFLITSGLVLFVTVIGIVVAGGQRPAQTASPTPAETPAAPAAPAPQSAPAPAATPTAPAPEAAQTAPETAPAPAPAPAADATKFTARVPEGMTPAAAGSSIGSLDPTVAPYRVTFSATGAGITEIVFSDFWKTFDDRRAAQRSRAGDADAKMPPDSARFVLSTPTKLGDFTVPVLSALRLEIDGARTSLFGAVWAEVAPGRFVTEIADADGRAVARVERAFVTSADNRSYELTLAQRVTNLTAAPMKVRLVQYGPGDLPRDAESAIDTRRFHFGYLYPPERDPNQAFVHTNGQMIDRASVLSQVAKGTPAMWPNRASAEGAFTLSWFGSTDRYFAFAVHAPAPASGTGGKKLTSIAEVQGVASGSATVSDQLVTSIWTPVVEVAPQATTSFDMGVYAGPLNPRILSHTEPFKGLGMGGLITYTMGGCCSWCTFAWLADGLLWFLTFIHDYVVFDWGLAIIGLVVVVRLILHPVQKKSQVAMQRFSRAMTAMKPELDALQKKFKDDPSRMQQEQMRLFREKGVSPAGCVGGMLPMFAQMPIWMALYAVLFFAFDLRQQPAFFGVFQTFGGWSFLADLSAQDNFFRFTTPVNLFLFNLSAINLLPVLMGIVFYFQQKYTSPPITPNMSAEQIQQQKIMKWMMVIMFPVMTYIAPSGLTLYILTSTCIGIIESRIIKKQIDAMDLTAKPVPGKKGLLARVYEQALERASEQQKKQAARGNPRGKGR